MTAHLSAILHGCSNMMPKSPPDEPTSPESVQLHHRAAGLSNDFNALSTTARLLSGRLQHGGHGRPELIQAELVVAAAEAALAHARALRDGLRGEASLQLDPEESLACPYNRAPEGSDSES